jgi:putative ABC transport system permease protein
MSPFIYIPAGILLFALLLASLLRWDKGRRSLVLALRSLWLHKLRSFLSVLGIIIGTGAVIALMAFGEGSMQDALEDIKRMGATNIIVRSVKPAENTSSTQTSRVSIYGLTQKDYNNMAVLQQGGTVVRMVPMRIFPRQIRYLGSTFNGRVVGTTPDYAIVNQLEMAVGRFLRDEDDAGMRNICVLGADTAAALFPFENPLGNSVKLDSHFYVVVGIVRDRMPTGGSGGSQAAEDFNADVYIPLATCNARFGETIMTRQAGSMSREQVALSQVTMTVADIDKVRPTGELVKQMLAENHFVQDWALTVPLDRLEEAERAKNRYKMLLVLIASISLLVGGIGIMNIMLATVTERTREIGIRRALGAKRRDITLQFLVEAVVQTTVGGLLGAIVGLGIVFIVPPLAEWIFFAKLPAKVHVPAIFLSLGVAITVGVLFGWYPARRAALLDPIEALRHE